MGGKLLQHVKECAHQAHTCQTETVMLVFIWEGTHAHSHNYMTARYSISLKT